MAAFAVTTITHCNVLSACDIWQVVLGSDTEHNNIVLRLIGPQGQLSGWSCLSVSSKGDMFVT